MSDLKHIAKSLLVELYKAKHVASSPSSLMHIQSLELRAREILDEIESTIEKAEL